ncbi:MAG: azurin [Proteobacteria bacterium]|nr:azurin [Pseudomonadota bacterium]
MSLLIRCQYVLSGIFCLFCFALATPLQAAGDDKKSDKTMTQKEVASDKKVSEMSEEKAQDKEGASEAVNDSKMCAQTVTADDMMKLSTKNLTVQASCQTFKLTLKHTGKMAATQMGHNLVITESAKMSEVVKAGLKAGPTKGYIPDSPDVLVSTKLLGGGEETTVEFSPEVLANKKDLVFFCLFPGHFSMMKGQVTVEGKAEKKSS